LNDGLHNFFIKYHTGMTSGQDKSPTENYSGPRIRSRISGERGAEDICVERFADE
jgi:hypothetical protein